MALFNLAYLCRAKHKKVKCHLIIVQCAMYVCIISIMYVIVIMHGGYNDIIRTFAINNNTYP